MLEERLLGALQLCCFSPAGVSRLTLILEGHFSTSGWIHANGEKDM